MKSLHFIVAALFAYITYLQFNDPDPAYWVAVYGGTAATAIGIGLNRYSRFLTDLLLGAVVAGLLIAAPGLLEFLAAGDLAAINDMGRAPYVEPAREFGGLLIALTVLVFYRQTARQRR